MKRPCHPALLAALTLLPAAAQTATVTLNGTPVTLSAVTVGGKTYVSLDGLRAALAAPGGANGQTALEGCRGEWLFNGIWRMRVTDVTPVKSPPGWAITVEWRNGTSQVITLNDTGVTRGTALALTSGDTWPNSEGYEWGMGTIKAVPQGAINLVQYRFWQPRGGDRNAALPTPDKLIVTVNPERLRQSSSLRSVRYTTPNPSFRVNLRCTR